MKHLDRDAQSAVWDVALPPPTVPGNRKSYDRDQCVKQEEVWTNSLAFKSFSSYIELAIVLYAFSRLAEKVNV